MRGVKPAQDSAAARIDLAADAILPDGCQRQRRCGHRVQHCRATRCTGNRLGIRMVLARRFLCDSIEPAAPVDRQNSDWGQLEVNSLATWPGQNIHPQMARAI